MNRLRQKYNFGAKEVYLFPEIGVKQEIEMVQKMLEEGSLIALLDSFNLLSICVIWVPKGINRDGVDRKNDEEIMTEMFSNLVKTKNPQI